MIKIVVNTPNAEFEKDLSDVIFEPQIPLGPNGKPRPLTYVTMFKGDNAKLVEETSLPKTLLINGVSFASDDPEAVDENGNRFDFCIACNDDESGLCEKCLAAVEKHFKDLGSYNVGINPLFVKNIVSQPRCPTITIALNRELYLDESKGRMRSSAYKLNWLLMDLYSTICGVL
jgi:hypothetical protein